jgi:hypothetical protein
LKPLIIAVENAVQLQVPTKMREHLLPSDFEFLVMENCAMIGVTAFLSHATLSEWFPEDWNI